MKQNNKLDPRGKSSRRREPLPSCRTTLLEMASSPTTPPRELQRMTKLGDTEIHALLAANPNTPLTILHKLWLAHPLCAVENPILLYCSLREGKPVHELLPERVRIRLYAELRKKGDDSALECHLPEAERLRWLSSKTPLIQYTQAQYESQAGSPAARPTHHSLQARNTSGNPGLEIYTLLTTDPSPTVRACLAKALDELPLPPAARTEILCILSRDVSPTARLGVACSRHLDRHLHLLLVGDEDSEVRNALAGNTNIPKRGCMEGWARLLAAGHGRTIALNPAGPESLKLQMISCGSPDDKRSAWAGLRFHQAADWQAISSELERVVSNPVRILELLEIARNPTIGGSLKSRLMGHPNPRVPRAIACQTHLTEQQRLCLLFHPDIRTALRAAKHTPPADFLDAAANHPNPRIRALLAKKTGDKTWGLRAKLVSDPDPWVRIALLKGLPEERPYNDGHRALLKRIVKAYVTDPDPRVRQLARRHPLAPAKRSPKNWLP